MGSKLEGRSLSLLALSLSPLSQALLPFANMDREPGEWSAPRKDKCAHCTKASGTARKVSVLGNRCCHVRQPATAAHSRGALPRSQQCSQGAEGFFGLGVSFCAV